MYTICPYPKNHKKLKPEARGMVSIGKDMAVKPGNLNSIPGTHTVVGEMNSHEVDL